MQPPEPKVVLPSEREIESTVMLWAAITPAANFEPQLLFRILPIRSEAVGGIVLEVSLLLPKLELNPKITTVPFVFHIGVTEFFWESSLLSESLRCKMLKLKKLPLEKQVQTWSDPWFLVPKVWKESSCLVSFCLVNNQSKNKRS